jgi:hypothetical protein
VRAEPVFGGWDGLVFAVTGLRQSVADDVPVTDNETNVKYGYKYGDGQIPAPASAGESAIVAEPAKSRAPTALFAVM